MYLLLFTQVHKKGYKGTYLAEKVCAGIQKTLGVLSVVNSSQCRHSEVAHMF